MTRPHEHKLKTWPVYFARLRDGSKTFEVRVNDRGFQRGDELHLQEWDPDRFSGPYAASMGTRGAYTGLELRYDITYVYTGPGVEPGYAVLGLDDGPWRGPAEPLHAWECPSCGSETRARMADHGPCCDAAATIERIKARFPGHDSLCDTEDGPDAACVCGYSDVWAAIRESPAGGVNAAPDLEPAMAGHDDPGVCPSAATAAPGPSRPSAAGGSLTDSGSGRV